MKNQTFKSDNQLTFELTEAYYGPSDSYELFDERTGKYYNRLGQELRDPSEYCDYSEGYTPFGDE